MCRTIVYQIRHASTTRTSSLLLRPQFAQSTRHAKLGNGASTDANIDRIPRKPHTIHIEGEESTRKRISGIR